MPLTDKEKEDMVAYALATVEGKALLVITKFPLCDSGLEVFGIYDSFQKPTKDMAIECLSRYEKNMANGKSYDDFIINAVNKIYDKWDIKRGEAISDSKVEPIKSRFDILDL